MYKEMTWNVRKVAVVNIIEYGGCFVFNKDEVACVETGDVMDLRISNSEVGMHSNKFVQGVYRKNNKDQAL